MCISVITLRKKKNPYKQLYFKCHLVTKPVFMDCIFSVHLDNTNNLGQGVVFTLMTPDSLSASFHLYPTISFLPLLYIGNDFIRIAE